jgi:phage/plasmid-like protein (TIGR03299 family)
MRLSEVGIELDAPAAAGETPLIDETGRLPWAYALTPEITRLLGGGRLITSRELNPAADLAWTVVQQPAFIETSGRTTPSIDMNGYLPPGGDDRFKVVGRLCGEPPALVPDVLLNVREDVHRVLGIVKQRYRLLQNSDAPHLIDRLVEAGKLRYELAGAIRGGAQVWWLARTTEAVDRNDDNRDRLETYVLLSNAHDGSTGTTVAVLPVRVASQTVMTWPLPIVQRSIVIRHTDSAKGQLAAADRLTDMIDTYQTAFLKTADRLLHTALTDEQFEQFLESLLPTPSPRVANGRKLNQRGITMAENAKGVITSIYWQNQSQQQLIGTVWGLVQACEVYSNHFTINRTTADTSADENRFLRLTSGTTLGSRAFSLASKLP